MPPQITLYGLDAIEYAAAVGNRVTLAQTFRQRAARDGYELDGDPDVLRLLISTVAVRGFNGDMLYIVRGGTPRTLRREVCRALGVRLPRYPGPGVVVEASAGTPGAFRTNERPHNATAFKRWVLTMFYSAVRVGRVRELRFSARSNAPRAKG